MSKILNTIKNQALVSRHDQLGVEESITIDNSVHLDGELIDRGTLLGKILAGTVGVVGKYRAYAEGVVLAAFAANSVNFTLDPSGAIAKHFRVGDVIQGTDGTALGTVATYNPLTGVGTLTGNSANAYAADGVKAVRIPLANLALAASQGKLLKDEVEMDDDDGIGVGYLEGFFVQSNTTLTAAAISALGAVQTDVDEIRLK